MQYLDFDEYKVYIGQGFKNQFDNDILSLFNGLDRVFLVTDDNVAKIYLDKALSKIKGKGLKCLSYTFKNGEQNKRLSTANEIMQFFSANNMHRNDIVVALGGGVVTDMVGFCSSIYLRGVRYISVPTTLLAMVDASVGGKTGIDTDFGKNLVGSFYNPSAVVIETDFLKTLPEDIFLDGIAEVIKYSLIYDKEIYNLLCNQDIDMPQVILKCVQAKKYFVMSDYKDHGLRNALNFGHTIAHAIEKDSNFAVSHGKAVAMGMAMAEKYIAKDTLIYKKICSMLERFCLPVEYYNKENLIKYICQDKKIEFDKVRFVLLEDIGKYKFEFISIEQIKNMLSYNGE